MRLLIHLKPKNFAPRKTDGDILKKSITTFRPPLFQRSFEALLCEECPLKGQVKERSITNERATACDVLLPNFLDTCRPVCLWAPTPSSQCWGCFSRSSGKDIRHVSTVRVPGKYWEQRNHFTGTSPLTWSSPVMSPLQVRTPQRFNHLMKARRQLEMREFFSRVYTCATKSAAATLCWIKTRQHNTSNSGHCCWDKDWWVTQLE